MQQLFIRQKGSAPIFMAVQFIDTTALNIAKNENNEIYFEGQIKFSGNDFDYLLSLKNSGVLEMELSYGSSSSISGVFSFAGEWDYKAKTALLDVKNSGLYEKFQQLLEKEFTAIDGQIQFDYDSWIYNVWGIGGYSAYYDDFVTCSSNPAPPAWELGKIYNGLTDYGSGAKAGDSNVAVSHNSKRWLSITPGNVFEPGVGNGVFTWLDVTGSISTIGQERADYQFSENAIFSDLYNYWYLGGCTASSYTNETRGYSIIGILNTMLGLSDFELDPKWLDHASKINPDYLGVYITNTEYVEIITLTEVINHVEVIFNTKWKLNGSYLTFKHDSELIQKYKGVPPLEHNYTGRDNIRLFKTDGITEVFEHRLNFSSSPDVENSIIDYNNNFVKSNTVKGNFDVDFKYATNKQGTNCPVLVKNSKIITENTVFLPSLLHELFYFDFREYENGVFNSVPVTLSLSYKETTTFEAGPELDITKFNVNYNCLLDFGLGRFKTISLNLQANKYKIEVAIQKPYS